MRVLEDVVRHHNQKVLGWRDVPIDESQLGPLARASMPVFKQLFIGRMCPAAVFERTLFMIRKRAGRRASDAGLPSFYIASLSSRTVVYKGLALPERLDAFYRDLISDETKSKLALVHSRFSTNTFPTWERAHPYRRIAHNGEINTLRGNQTWMARARAAPGERSIRRAPRRLQAHHPAGRQRLGVARQPRRLPRRGRTKPSPRDDDARARGVGRAARDAAGAARLLRVPRVAGRALGRPGRARFHRRRVTSAPRSTATACAP